MPDIARQLDRIAAALEDLAVRKVEEDTIHEYPRCEWCDHRHFPTARCVEYGCDCKQ